MICLIDPPGLHLFDPKLGPEAEGYLPPGPSGHTPCGDCVGTLAGRVFFCTRAEDHDGQHAAHNLHDEMFATWGVIQ